MSIILFATVGYIEAYKKEINIANIRTTIGDFEVIFKNLTETEANFVKNNVLVNNAGIYREILPENNYDNFYLYAVDEIFLKNLFGKVIEMKEGRLPVNSNEIIISEVGSINQKKGINNYINIKNKSYKIVGIFVHSDIYAYEKLGGLTFIDDNVESNTINLAINTKTKKDKYKNIMNIAKSINKEININDHNEDVVFNNALLYAYGMDIYNLNNNIDLQYLVINLAIFILSTFFIYGFINISMKERIKQFSILRCIGATTTKIRVLIIKESVIFATISIIPGIILSIIMNFLIYNILLKVIPGTYMELIGFKIYPRVIIYVIFFTIISIFIATIPIIRATNIAPIYGLKNTNLSQKNFKIRKSSIVRNLFGYNGELAYKNLRGDNKYFLINTIISTLLISIFIIFTGFNKSLLDNYKSEVELSKDITIDISPKEEISNVVDEMNKYKEDILNIEGVKKVHSKAIYSIQGIFSGVKLNNGYKKLSDKNDYGEEKLIIDNKEYVYSNNISLLILEDDYIKILLNEMDSDKLYKSGAFIVQRNTTFGNSTRDKLFNIKKGDKIQLIPAKHQIINGKYRLDENELNNLLKNGYPLDIIYLDELKKENIINGKRYGGENSTTLIVAQSFYVHNKGLFDSAKLEVSNIELTIELDNSLNREIQFRKIKNFSSLIGGVCIDNKVINDRYSLNVRITATIIYLILGLSIIIGTVNIVNNKNIYMKLRSKEIGILLAIGINKKRLKNILLLEGIMQWLIASILSLGLSFISLNIIYVISNYNNDSYVKYIPVKESILGCVIFLFINVLGIYLSIMKMDFTKTTELTKNDE